MTSTAVTEPTVPSLSEEDYPWVVASTLVAGQQFLYNDVVCTVLVPAPETNAVDFFGRPMHEIMASRADTGASGRMLFGPGGMVRLYEA